MTKFFDEALEEGRIHRAAVRVRHITLAFTFVVTLAAMGYVFLQIDGELERSSSVNSDNVTWTMAQVERLERNLRQQGQILYDIRRGQIERNVIDLEQKSKRNSDEEFRLRALKEDMRRLDTQIDQMGKK